ncbi:hypothetical protein [Halostagnicola sp. A-GB9-2]|uniref:hypothetical protein n=1 Tax=Halostagnicola sp. A-GB9-2 TaxID=3048066 RepID=UPI0024C0B635|nr:hypothetical protein [Halostagnicola sp. A-GB9-2]MDJ1434312.1 hypothetical protein [Halostagnicola sp. A-GB9-2]
MSNPFDDLESNETEDTENKSEPNSSSNTATTTQTEPAQTESVQETTTKSEPPEESGPGFEYSEVRQKPLYARDKTWDELEDKLGIRVTPELRRMEIRDEETREVHDALLKVALDHIDEVPEQILATREES